LAVPSPLSVTWLAGQAGMAPNTASGHLTTLRDLGLIVKLHRTHAGYVNADTGEIVTPRTEVLVKPRAASAAAFALACAAFVKPAPAAGRSTWGGKRAGAGRKRCGVHPDAAVTRTVIDSCGECGEVFSETVATIPAAGDQGPKIRAVARESELDCPHTPVSVLKGYQVPIHAISVGVYGQTVDRPPINPLQAVHARLLAGARP